MPRRAARRFGDGQRANWRERGLVRCAQSIAKRRKINGRPASDERAEPRRSASEVKFLMSEFAGKIVAAGRRAEHQGFPLGLSTCGETACRSAEAQSLPIADGACRVNRHHCASGKGLHKTRTVVAKQHSACWTARFSRGKQMCGLLNFGTNTHFTRCHVVLDYQCAMGTTRAPHQVL